MTARNVVAVVQARMGATRLPGKMLLPLHGIPVIEWVLKRTASAKLLDGLVVAIPSTSENDILASAVAELEFDIYRGSEEDVLDRFYRAALSKNATRIIRICADNPLICGSEIDNLIDFFDNNKCDYAYNHVPKGNRYPDGLGAEIVSMDVLERVHREATLPAHREHCLSYIVDNPQLFEIKTFDPPDAVIAFPDLSLDIDTMEDLRKLSAIELSIDMSSREIISIFRSSAK